MTTRDMLLDAVRAAAQQLAPTIVWFDRAADDNSSFVYEAYVLIEFLYSLHRAGWKVKVLHGHGPNKHCLPMAPAAKANGWASFEVTSPAGDTFEICAGTEIGDISGDARAPDISVQFPVGVLRPTHENALAIFDAKFKTKGGGITSHEFSEFARWLDLLDVKHVVQPFGVTPFDRNALVTNGVHSTENDRERDRTGVTEVFDYHPHGVPKSKP